ncbi:MAG: hypothetical protein WBD76_03215 [Methyloceanibacter sp.]|jgi:hypothetical protein
MHFLAASTFHQTGQTDMSELGEVYKFLAPLLGLRAHLDGDRDPVLNMKLLWDFFTGL